MRIREDDRNIVLLAAVMLVSTVVAGTLALLEPTGQVQVALRDNQAADVRPVNVVDQSAVRVVGTPFVPNVNPRER